MATEIDNRIRESIDLTFSTWSVSEVARVQKIPATIFLSDPNERQPVYTQYALMQICETIGFDLEISSTPQLTSWFRRFLFRSRESIPKREVVDRLRKAERAIEIAALDKPQAEADRARLEGAAAVLTAIGDNEAVVQVGTVLIVRRNGQDGAAKIAVRSMSQKELIYLENNPALLKAPQSILDSMDSAKLRKPPLELN